MVPYIIAFLHYSAVRQCRNKFTLKSKHKEIRSRQKFGNYILSQNKIARDFSVCISVLKVRQVFLDMDRYDCPCVPSFHVFVQRTGQNARSRLTRRHISTKYRGMQVLLHAFLTSQINEGQLSHSHHDPVPLRRGPTEPIG
jgi:hypothetical protein